MPEQRELIRLLGTRFIQRRDVKAIQRSNGEWNAEKTPFTLQDFIDHLNGTKTFGHYLLDPDNLCKLFAFDIDFVKHGQECPGNGCKGCPVKFDNLGEPQAPHREFFIVEPREIWNQTHPLPDKDIKETLTIHLRCMAEGLAIHIDRVLGIPVGIHYSGNKGIHVYGFTGPIPADAAREMALSILNDFGCFVPTRGQNFFKHESQYPTLEIEVFPKQSSLNQKEFGNLMALPLGINQKSKSPKHFVHCKGPYQTLPVMDPLLALDGHQPWE